MGKTRALWEGITFGAILFWIVGAGVAYAAAYQSYTPPPAPTFVTICLAAVSGKSIAALVGAITSGIGMLASLVQLFGPKPLGESLARKFFARIETRADQRQAELEGAIWTEGQASEERDLESELRDTLTHRLLTGDITERVAAAVDADVLSDEQKRRLRALADRIEAETPATADQALRAAETVFALQASSEPEERRAAVEAFGGDLEVAADRLMVEGEAGKRRNAERFRQAARLYAPSAPSKAMAAYREAVDLAPADFGSWIELGRLRMQYGSLADARACFGAALQHVADERDREVVYGAFGNVLATEGQLGDAATEYASALVIAERLAAREPDNTDWQHDLSVSHSKLGNIAVSAGDLDAARRRYEASLAIHEQLVAQEPDNAEWQRALLVSYSKLGDVAASAGDLDEARRRYEAGLAIAEGLAVQEPGNGGWQRDLSVSHERLGDVAESAGDLDEARRRYEASLVSIERLAARDPGNAGWQRDLSVSHTKLGDVAESAGDLGEARRRYEASLAIRHRLAVQEPGNAEWQRDLMVSHGRLGDVAESVGDLGEVRRRYEAGLAIAERLAAQEPGNADWQRDLFVSNARLAQLAEADGDAAGATERFAAAEKVMAALVALRPDHDGFARDLATVQQDLALLRG